MRQIGKADFLAIDTTGPDAGLPSCMMRLSFIQYPDVESFLEKAATAVGQYESGVNGLNEAFMSGLAEADGMSEVIVRADISGSRKYQIGSGD